MRRRVGGRARDPLEGAGPDGMFWELAREARSLPAGLGDRRSRGRKQCLLDRKRGPTGDWRRRDDLPGREVPGEEAWR